VKVPIKQYGVEGRYSEALYIAATKAGKTDVVEKELEDVTHMLENEKLASIMYDPSMNPKTKEEIVMSLLKEGGFSDLTTNFFGTLATNGRMSAAPKVYDKFTELTRADRGEVRCKVITSIELNDEQYNAAMEKCAQELKGVAKKITLESEVDLSIRGGWILEIGDKYLDYSGRTRMRKMRSLLDGGVESLMQEQEDEATA